MKAYDYCPKCKLTPQGGIMKPIGERTGGFSVGKAAVGGVLLGPVGLVAGALGKKKVTLVCDNCGYTVET